MRERESRSAEREGERKKGKVEEKRERERVLCIHIGLMIFLIYCTTSHIFSTPIHFICGSIRRWNELRETKEKGWGGPREGGRKKKKRKK